MWSFFSRDPTRDFNYEIGKSIEGLEERSIWSVHNGKKKSNGEPVTVFCFDVKSSSESQVQTAKTSLKKMKTLRHPNLLMYLDGLENDKVIYIVTEQVTPLEIHLKSNTDDEKSLNMEISWGLHQVSKGLSFLINDCNLIHNNVCLSSVFVDKSGEWKLGGIDYMYPASGMESIPAVKTFPALERYDPPERGGQGKKPTELWSTDSWGLGCLVWEVFNGSLLKISALKALGKIPKTLVPHYGELVSANPKSRPNPAKFIQNCRSAGSFMDNKFVDTMLFFEEIQIMDQAEKNNFFDNLPSDLDEFPESFCRYKILPQLLHAFEFGNAGSSVLAPLFKLGKCLDSAEYQEKIVPCIVKLFSSQDRATRVKLLQQIEVFVEHLNSSIVNEKIFPNLIHGFNDTNPVVREHTIKGMMHLAPKLNYKNLNEELLKHFARLQSKDDQGGIRTNTTICLGKIAGYLNPDLRQKILTSAYMRAMKDPFPPARQAAMIAMAATNNFFTLQESSSRLLPALCTMVMDPEKVVRDQAFKAIKCYLSKLEKASENPELITEIEKDVKSGGIGASTSGSWTGWAVGGVSSLTSKLYKGKSVDQKQASPLKKREEKTSPVEKHVPAENPKAQITRKEQTEKKSSDSTYQKAQMQYIPDESYKEEDNKQQLEKEESWNDWGDISDDNESKNAEELDDEEKEDYKDNEDTWESLEQPSSQHKFGSSNTTKTSNAMKLGTSKKEQMPSPWGMDDFVAVEDNNLVSTSSYNWGPQSQLNEDDFFGSLLQEDKKSKSQSQTRKETLRLSTTDSKKKTASEETNIVRSKKTKDTSAYFDSDKNTENNMDDFESWDTSEWGESKKTVNQSKNNAGGWEFDNWDNTETQELSKSELLKKKRDERKLKQQKELAEKRAARQGTGAMKLGAKKLAKD